MRWRLTWAILVLLAGCHRNEIKLTQQEEVVTPDAWTAVRVDDSKIISDWWQSFQDPALEDFVTRALERNYNLRATAARLDAAVAQARIAGAPLYPSISGGWRGSGQRQNFIGLPIPGAEGKVLSRTFSSWGISLDISWEADVWGRVAAGRQAALADYDAARADLRGAKLSLVAQTSKAWFAAIEGLQQLDLAERTVSSYSSTAERVRWRYRQGLQSSLDLRLALSSLAGAEALVEQRQEQLERGIRQLEILMGQYPAAALTVVKELPVVPPTPPTGIPSDLISRRPDLVAAERRMFASGARWVQSKRALYPRFSLNGSIGTSSSSTLSIFNGDFFVWSLVGNILQPIFEGGRLRAQIDLDDARTREAAASWANSVLLALSEVESALAAEKYLVEQEQDLAEAAAQSIASLRLAEDRYNSGLESFVTVLEAQRRSLSAESQLLTARRQRLDARVDLHLALGGGFAEVPTPQEEKES
jgi:NodT family efflux transporter outer membrane factor (OMF) lipoprotein